MKIRLFLRRLVLFNLFLACCPFLAMVFGVKIINNNVNNDYMSSLEFDDDDDGKFKLNFNFQSKKLSFKNKCYILV